MSDPTINKSVQVQQWIEERRAIHSEGTGVLLRNPYELNREYDLWDEDANAIADAHNMLPRALDALSKVLELHKPNEIGECPHCGHDSQGSAIEWPCPTVQAIEGATNE